MIAVVVTLCMIQAPDKCVERAYPLPGANEVTCYKLGQPEVARDLLPGWRVVRYGCERMA